jgi:hypothetical protein
MDPEWRQRAASNWWSTDYRGRLEPAQMELLRLRDRLLKFGGDAVCLPVLEEDFHKIMERGQAWLGERAILKRGQPSQCHFNSAALWDANRTLAHSTMHIATGYALSPDGMWRQHSWCVWEKPRSLRIVETTEPRAAYYGFVMLPKEAEQFLFDNL